MVPGARSTAVRAGLIAVSTHSSNAKPLCPGLADFVCAIHSQGLRLNLEGAIVPPARKSDRGSPFNASTDPQQSQHVRYGGAAGLRSTRALFQSSR